MRAQQQAAHLPDCRAYEIVNPPGNEFGDVARVVQVDADGDRVAYVTDSPGEGVASVFLYSMLVGERSPGGWSARDADMAAAAPAEPIGTWTPVLLAEDFGSAIISTNVAGDPADDGTSLDLYRVPVGSGRGTRLSSPISIVEPPTVIGASVDGSRVAWAEIGIGAIWTTTDGGDLERVSVLPDGSPADLGGSLAGTNLARGYPGWPAMNVNQAPGGGAHAMSVDGRRIYFSALDPGGSGGASLYLRDLVAGTTVAAVVSQRSGEAGPRPASDARFLAATPDGRFVFYASAEQLTDDATVGGGIYRYDVVGGGLELVTAPTGGSPLELSSVLLSDDGSHLYFAASNALLPGAVEGESNVYVVGPGGTDLVATGAALSRVSADGRFALLQSRAPLGGAPTAGHEAVFEYDDASGDLLCASCRPDGSPSQGDSFVDRQSRVALVPILAGPRGLADDGTVFFSSDDRLLARDQGDAFDAYAFGAGALSLLSRGGGEESVVAESSADGSDVFIDTRAPLVAADRDAGELDVYDVRVGGGFLEPLPPLACAGVDCRGPGPEEAPAPALETATFVGPGNAGARRHHRRKHRRRACHRRRAHGQCPGRGRGGRR